jgi:hypothetical protein
MSPGLLMANDPKITKTVTTYIDIVMNKYCFLYFIFLYGANVRLTCRRGKRDQRERLGPAFGHEFNRLLGLEFLLIN